MITNSQKRIIHVAAKRDLKLDDDAYRSILQRVAGVDSAKDLDHRGFDKVMAEFTRLGFCSTSARKPLGERDFMATDAQLALIRKLWRSWSSDGTERGLRTWLRVKFKVDDLRFLTLAAAPGVIAALRAMNAQKRKGDNAAA